MTDREPRPSGRLLYDVQRDLSFYRTIVAVRDAIERLQVLRGTVDDPDQVFWWWGFGYLGGSTSEGGPGRGDGGSKREDGGSIDWDDPDLDGDDRSGSRVPRRPPGGAGAASAEAEPDLEDALQDAIRSADLA